MSAFHDGGKMTDAFKTTQQLAISLGLVLTKDDYDSEMVILTGNREDTLYRSTDVDVINAFLLGWTACLSRR
jgi:hypothetical protein